jgi:glutamate synthase (NADPH/NADH) large chain
VGADPLLGDGAGILIQIPDALFRDWAEAAGVTLPQPGDYAVAMCFLPRAPARDFIVEAFREFHRQGRPDLIGWRDVPTDADGLGKAVIEQMPVIRQCFIAAAKIARIRMRSSASCSRSASRRRTRWRALAEKHGLPGLASFYMPSLLDAAPSSTRACCSPQVGSFYDDLRNPLRQSALALVHQRFSTNTFPSWKLAHPYRFIAHNGEINTVRGNVNWMNARRRTMESELLGPDLDKMWPLIPHGQSDTACLDNALELLVAGGYSLAHAVMMLIPEAWAGNPLMDAKRRAFYEYHAALMEPWDGPAAVAFTDGRQIGATLDRNGLRPARFSSPTTIMSSWRRKGRAADQGREDRPQVAPAARQDAADRSRAGPHHRGRGDQGELAKASPMRTGSNPRSQAEGPARARRAKNAARDERPARCSIASRPSATRRKTASSSSSRWRATGDDPIGSMGTDTPIAVLSNQAEAALRLFQAELRAGHQPADRSDPRGTGDEPGVDDRPAPEPARHRGRHAQAAGSDQPILTNADLRRSARSARSTAPSAPRPSTSPGTPPNRARRPRGDQAKCAAADRGGAGGQQHPDPVGPRAGAGPAFRCRRCWPPRRASPPDPQGLRMQTGLVVETGERAKCIISACWPAMAPKRSTPISPSRRWSRSACAGPAADAYEVQKNYIKAVGKGILKVMSKMGISTYQSYCGAQIFDAVGLSSAFVEKYFTGTATTIEGVGLEGDRRGDGAPPRAPSATTRSIATCSMSAAIYAFRMRGEDACLDARRVAKLQHAVRGNLRRSTRNSRASINEQSERLLTIRGLMEFKTGGRKPSPLERGRAGIRDRQALRHRRDELRLDQREAHTTLAIAMNRIGGKSNTGEGGEDPTASSRCQRRFDALGDQAGRLGPLRRDHRISRQRRRHPDQDGAGRQARRRRPAARPQGRQDHRQGAPLDAGRRPDLAAAAPRHLFDRGSGAADPRPEERQPRARASRSSSSPKSASARSPPASPRRAPTM